MRFHKSFFLWPFSHFYGYSECDRTGNDGREETRKCWELDSNLHCLQKHHGSMCQEIQYIHENGIKNIYIFPFQFIL